MRVLAVALLALTAATADAGARYKVTAKDGDKDVTYNVDFGGGRKFERWTAFDPASKKFVYLDWNRDEAEPKPAGSIWDHRTGETIKLYKFPGVEAPLPVIPSITEMKVCPLTGDKKFKAERFLNYD
ncbi:hypothetical protein J8F10_04945 [Gemmata sp. G18]|uniref:Uncharacterized protein n=1 Tax=Gemmata palustris TaxID=2822762 RepID=A0ABS5BLT0_9BACT|nr:hypothetical protein [Gemmata palustris]MBP3954630.1 hypothetical protein [Gemmata palustris]